MLEFKRLYAAQKTLAGAELVCMIKKGQMRRARGDVLSPAVQFYILVS